MHSKDLLSTAFRGITVNKTRTALTMLGIIIGVASVVLMISMGNSFQNYILKTIESVGTGTMDVYPVGMEQFGGATDTLTEDDYEAIKRLSTVQNVAPVIIVNGVVSYGREEKSPMVMGTNSNIFANYQLKVAQGRLLDDGDVEGSKNVAVIGGQTATDLFGDQNALGKRITVKEQSFTVVGVLQKQGSLLLQDLDKIVFMPITAARALTGQKNLSYLTLKVKGDSTLAEQDVTELLRQRHRIDNPDGDIAKDDFRARGSDQITSIVGSVTMGLTIFLSLVAAISLLVGGIGIMNIMLVSVTERTREIGLRKAVGARSRDILLQFLLEAVALTFTGGAVGVLIGTAMGWLLSQAAAAALGSFEFILSLPSILMAVAMAIGIGLVFGIFPAKKAAGLSPMEALRYE